MIDAFLKYITSEVQLSAQTVEAYRSDLRQWERFATSDGLYPLCPETTTLSDLRLWVASLSRAGLLPRSIRRKIQSLRAFFRFLMKYHGLKSNPAVDLQVPKVANGLPVYVRSEEMSAMLDSDYDADDYESVRDRLVVDMLYHTGLRCSELMTLTDGNVDAAKCELKVHGKRNKDRIVPFGPELRDMITLYRRLRDEIVNTLPGDEFFRRSDGRPLYRKQVYNIVHSAMDLAGVHAARKSPHVLRHTFATDMLNGGAQLTSVQQLLGHRSLNATQVYTHISYRDLKQNYQQAHPRAQKKGG